MYSISLLLAISISACGIDKSQTKSASEASQSPTADYSVPKSADDFEKTKIIAAINQAAEYIEWFLGAERGKNEFYGVIYGPHFDYTHFNRIGNWEHNDLLDFELDYGGGLFDKQREEAIANYQPTDRMVSIAERTIVSAANFTGRYTWNQKDSVELVPKHFPGGSPELERTEYQHVIIDTPFTEYQGRTVFEKLINLEGFNRIMISHAAYPGFESHFQTTYQYLDKKIQAELATTLGIEAATYAIWIKNRPATTSPVILEGYLRQELGFKGLIMPDSLEMSGFNAPVKDFLVTTMSETAINELVGEIHLGSSEKVDAASAALAVIMTVYAGVQNFKLSRSRHFNQDIVLRYAHFPGSSYFRKKLFDLFQFGKNLPEDAVFQDTVDEIVFEKVFRRGGGGVDVWDRSGNLHQKFRRKLLQVLWDDVALFSDQVKFWQASQAFDWATLDPYFNQVLQQRYLDLKEK